MICQRCKKRGKDWNGDDPTCAFAKGKRFSGENWNCATANAVRDIVYEGQHPMPDAVDYRYCEDMKYATVKIDDLEMDNGNRIGMALWVAWYKSRGKTDAIWILDYDEPPRAPTEKELNRIIEAFGARATAARDADASRKAAGSGK